MVSHHSSCTPRLRLWVPYIIYFPAVLISFLYLCGCTNKEFATESKAAKVVKGDLSDNLSLGGILQAETQVNLKSEIAGRILRIHVKEGARLKKGQPILDLDPEQLGNRRKRDELKVRRSRIQLEQARRNLESAQGLQGVGGASAHQIKDLQWQVQLAEIQFKEDELALEEAELYLSKTRVAAPATGTLISLSVKEGEVIMDGTASYGGGSSLGVLADLSRKVVTVMVSELDRPNIHYGQTAFISTEADRGKKYRGHVQYLSKMALEVAGKNVRNFEVKVALDSAADPRDSSVQVLAPGINVNVDFRLFDLQNVLVVPSEMIYQGKAPDDPPVFVWERVSEGRRKRAVKVGATNYQFTQILSGLEEGQTIEGEVAKPPSEWKAGS